MRFFCSRAGPRAAPCLVKIPLYSRPSRFQSAFIISFLKNLSSRSQQPTPRLPARLFSSFLSLRLSLSPYFSPLLVFLSLLSRFRDRETSSFFFLFFFLFSTVREEKRGFFQSRISLHSEDPFARTLVVRSYAREIVLRCEFGDG